MKSKERLDKIIADLGLAENRTRAQALIMAGKVRVDNQVVTKAGTQISQDLVDKIQVESVNNWASRGARHLMRSSLTLIIKSALTSARQPAASRTCY